MSRPLPPLYEESKIQRFIRERFEATEAGIGCWLALSAAMLAGMVMIVLSAYELMENGFTGSFVIGAVGGLMGIMFYPLALVASDWQRDKNRADQSAARQAAERADHVSLLRELKVAKAVVDDEHAQHDADTRQAVSDISRAVVGVRNASPDDFAAALEQEGLASAGLGHDTVKLSAAELAELSKLAEQLKHPDS